MRIRFRSHETVVQDGAWTQRQIPLREFGLWHRCWREDFAIEVNVLGHWTPAHIVLATEVIPSAA
jgi:hypothetical protein